MDRRNFTISTGGTALCFLLGGCTTLISSESGAPIDLIKVLNVQETSTDFTIFLRDDDDETVYEESISVEGTPGNRYVRKEITDLPQTPVIEAEARVEGDSIRKAVPESGETVEMTVICNPDGEVGIAWFGRETETQN